MAAELDDLVRDGRYLFELRCPQANGKVVRRLAPTVLGLHVFDDDLYADHERDGLRQTHEILTLACDEGMFRGHPVPLERIRRSFEPTPTRYEFARWVTYLASPRLCGLRDPHGYAGLALASGKIDPRTGYFEDLDLFDGFTSKSPRRKLVTRRPLLSTRWRAEVTDLGVQIYSGQRSIAALRPTLGPLVLARLLANPHTRHHATDLQTGVTGAPAPSGSCPITELLGPIKVREDQRHRAAAIARRFLFVRSLPPTSKVPAWGTELRTSGACAEFEADIAAGKVTADHPIAKNAAKVVRGALDRTLDCEALKPLAALIAGHEVLVYSPPK